MFLEFLGWWRRARLGGSMLVAVGVAACLGLAPAFGQPPVTVEAVTKAWQDRQDKVKTARIEWTERETVPKGSISNKLQAILGPRPSAEEGRADAVIPPTDTTNTLVSSILLDGDRIRFERDDAKWSYKENKFLTVPFMTTFDGKTGKLLTEKGGGEYQFPEGIVEKGHTGYMDGSYFIPVALAYRPWVSRISHINPAAMSLTGRKALVDNRWCLELEQQERGQVLRVWVDPGRDYIVTRLMALLGERLYSKVDLHYAGGGEKEIPQLEKWESVRFSNKSQMERATQVSVSTCLLNGETKGADFDLHFPPGTHVVDRQDPSREKEYLIKPDGRQRVIEGNEHRAPYETLMNTEQGEAFGPKPYRFPTSILVVAALVGILALSLFFWRRYSKRKSVKP